MKIRCNTPELVADLPKEFLLLWEHLQTLRYEDEPDYVMLTTAFRNCLIAAGGSPDNPLFDWDLAASSSSARARTLPRLTDLCLRAVASGLDRVAKLPPKMAPQLKERLLQLALRLNPKLPEHLVLKLLDGTTQELDFGLMEHAGTGPAAAPGVASPLFVQAVSHCPNVQRLTLSETSDAKVAEMLRLHTSRLLQQVSLVALPKVFSVNKGLRPLIEGNAQTLTRVQLGGESVKDAFVEAVIKGCPRLQALLLPGCRKVKVRACLLWFLSNFTGRDSVAADQGQVRGADQHAGHLGVRAGQERLQKPHQDLRHSAQPAARSACCGIWRERGGRDSDCASRDATREPRPAHRRV